MLTMSPIIIVAYALIFSMVSVDVSMSLAPHFFANMFPAWYFMSAGWSGLVWTAIIAIAFGKWMGIENLTRPKDFHDIGKLSFAFCMFWGYTTFAQYLPIWSSEQTCVCAVPVFRDVQRMTSPLRMTANTKAAPADFIINNGSEWKCKITLIQIGK